MRSAESNLRFIFCTLTLNLNMENKPWYLSKTLWINALAAASMVIPVVGNYVSAHPGIAIDGLAAVNFVLRILTKSGIQIA